MALEIGKDGRIRLTTQDVLDTLDIIEAIQRQEQRQYHTPPHIRRRREELQGQDPDAIVWTLGAASSMGYLRIQTAAAEKDRTAEEPSAS
jgi:hypothetical protein